MRNAKLCKMQNYAQCKLSKALRLVVYPLFKHKKIMKADLVKISDMGMNFTLNVYPSNPQNPFVLSKKPELSKTQRFLYELVMAQNLGPHDSNKSQANKKVLNRDTNSEKRQDKCNQCDYASSHRSNLRIHLMRHSGEKLNKCNQCDFASSQSSNLRIHFMTHTGEKLNKCNQCDYESSLACNLKRHLKTHGEEKSNKCKQCDYASSYANALRAHLKTHTGEKPNKCKCNLGRHLNTHREKTNKCN